MSKNILLDRLLGKTVVSQISVLDNIIDFYKTILELERLKEPDINTYYTYTPYFKDDDNDVILIDLPCNLDFKQAFLENNNKTYPKNLYVGLPVTIKNKPGQVIAFSLTIDHNDLDGYDPDEHLLPVRISYLSLDSRHIDELELTKEKIEEIEGEIGQVKSFSDLQELVKRHLGENVELKMELQLGLSSKNIALAQISSELNRLDSNMVVNNDLLKHFLLHTQFNNQIDDMSVNDLIQISLLDDCQAKVVAHALNNRFTVVTGAPGTGKTQVILNIIANALMKDKSVLVASKNNKAVDNVKERFDSIDSSLYLLRFGRKECLRKKTVPALLSILGRLNLIQRQPETLSTLLSQYNDVTETVNDAKSQLSEIDDLKNILIPQLKENISRIQSEINEENQKFSSTCAAIKSEYHDVSHLENISSDLDSIECSTSRIRRFRNFLQLKYSGLSGIWHNLFSKKKHAETLLDYVEDLPPLIKTELRNRDLSYSIDDFKNGNDIIEHSCQVISLLERISDFHDALAKEISRHDNTISDLSKKLGDENLKYYAAEKRLKKLTDEKDKLENLINQYQSSLIDLGQQLVAAKIMEIEKGNDAANKISAYSAFLPGNIPWASNNMPNFISKSKDFLSICRLISVTSLSIKAGFPLTDNLFDILIIDEASQCDIASALPLILRARQVVVIGDPMQLRHITSVSVDEENTTHNHFKLSAKPHLKYAEQSLYDYSTHFLAHANENSNPITLENHYRCHHDIIGYSNRQFYGQFLKELNVVTDESKMTLPQQGVVMVNVHGKQVSEHINRNIIEAQTAVTIATEIYAKYTNISVGIVTPFRDQADYMKSLIKDPYKGKIEVNTAHGFQGDEKDVMIYSLVVTDNTPQRKVNWIDDMVPNLVNVAVTRARQTLYIVGNADYIKSVSPEGKALGSLIRYAQS